MTEDQRYHYSFQRMYAILIFYSFFTFSKVDYGEENT